MNDKEKGRWVYNKETKLKEFLPYINEELTKRLELLLLGSKGEVSLEARHVLATSYFDNWALVEFEGTETVCLIDEGDSSAHFVEIGELIDYYHIRIAKPKTPLITETEYEFLRFFPNDASLVVGADDLVSISRGSSSFVLVHFNLCPFNSVVNGEDSEYTVGKLIEEYERVNCPRRERNE